MPLPAHAAPSFVYERPSGQYRFYTGKTHGLVTTGWAKGVYTLSVDLGDGVGHAPAGRPLRSSDPAPRTPRHSTLEQADLAGAVDGFAARMHVELAEEVANVCLERVLGDVEPSGDLRLREMRGEQLEYAALGGGQVPG